MHIDALSKALSLYDMHDVFQLIPEQALNILQSQLETVFECQEALALCATSLMNDLSNTTLIQDESAAIILSSKAVQDLNSINIHTSDLLNYFKKIDVAKIYRSSVDYAQYGAGQMVENISWSGDRIINTYKEPLRDRIREGLIDVCPLELGGPLVFKLMIDIILDVEDSDLRSTMQSLQTMHLKDIPRENVLTAVSYLKGAIMLLQNCDTVLTDTLGILHDIMTSTDCDKFTEYMKSIYFASKRNNSASVSSFTSYLNTADFEYITLYRAGK